MIRFLCVPLPWFPVIWTSATYVVLLLYHVLLQWRLLCVTFVLLLGFLLHGPLLLVMCYSCTAAGFPVTWTSVTCDVLPLYCCWVSCYMDLLLVMCYSCTAAGFPLTWTSATCDVILLYTAAEFSVTHTSAKFDGLLLYYCGVSCYMDLCYVLCVTFVLLLGFLLHGPSTCNVLLLYCCRVYCYVDICYVWCDTFVLLPNFLLHILLLNLMGYFCTTAGFPVTWTSATCYFCTTAGFPVLWTSVECDVLLLYCLCNMKLCVTWYCCFIWHRCDNGGSWNDWTKRCILSSIRTLFIFWKVVAYLDGIHGYVHMFIHGLRGNLFIHGYVHMLSKRFKILKSLNALYSFLIFLFGISCSVFAWSFLHFYCHLIIYQWKIHRSKPYFHDLLFILIEGSQFFVFSIWQHKYVAYAKNLII